MRHCVAVSGNFQDTARLMAGVLQDRLQTPDQFLIFLGRTDECIIESNEKEPGSRFDGEKVRIIRRYQEQISRFICKLYFVDALPSCAGDNIDQFEKRMAMSAPGAFIHKFFQYQLERLV